MREEISEPQQWRSNSQRNHSWASRSRTHEHTELAAEAVDAALAEVATEAHASDSNEQLATADIVTTLASQLDLLEQQREQLQRLLDQAQASH